MASGLTIIRPRLTARFNRGFSLLATRIQRETSYFCKLTTVDSKVGTVTCGDSSQIRRRFDAILFCETFYFPTIGSTRLDAVPFERYTLCVAVT
jgi:hypothetical protein